MVKLSVYMHSLISFLKNLTNKSLSLSGRAEIYPVIRVTVRQRGATDLWSLRFLCSTRRQIFKEFTTYRYKFLQSAFKYSRHTKGSECTNSVHTALVKMEVLNFVPLKKKKCWKGKEHKWKYACINGEGR